ncbi:MAG: LamG domain-containing protein, partial [Akkermansiaceae bacterium]|nr:LamG domain-containing protein [Akkermansiaceae bacterium]
MNLRYLLKVPILFSTFFIGISLITTAQIPDPFLYYNFDDPQGTQTVTDGSGNDREGAVTGNVTFGADGAPNGSTPAAAAQFSVGGTGYISINSVDVPNDFGNRDQEIEASYTMACWIKPDPASFSGDRFYFGQGSQGIHHGFRGGNLYHAHWGSDFQGQQRLNPDEWAHTTFTYDADNNRGAIYVNGVFDSEMNNQQGPNGGGALIIGGRNGGGENYVGLIDDLAIWQEVLNDDQIEALSKGVSPSGIGSTDEDEDGLPDYWEDKYGLDTEDNGSIDKNNGPEGDPDEDGLTNVDELENRTDPKKADTDEDGLKDGVETNTGTYVSATNTGTDPKNADTDKDGLLDGVETGTGELVDKNNTGTDPNNADTDEDGYADGGEIVGGTDPNDENSKGALPPPFLYLSFEEDTADLSENALDGEIDGQVSIDVDGASGGSTPETGASFNGGHIDFPGFDMNSMIRDFGDGSYTFSCWLKPIGSAGGQGFIWGQTNQGIHNGIRNGGLLHSAHWGADWNASTVLEAEEWVHAAWVYDGESDTATIYLNGEIDGGPTPQRPPNGGGTLVLGARNNGESQFDGELDDVAIWREALPEGSILAIAEGVSPIGATMDDDDNDGLPDYWEDKYGVDDPEADPDEDGLSNLEEFESKTKPDKADTDEDGLLDGVETGTGTFVSADDTGTLPKKADSDGDGILDGDEVTNPFSDPNDPDDPPPPPFSDAVIGHWTFEDGEELTDLMGNFPDLKLEGDAQIADGSLDVNGSGTTASGWAWSSGEYQGPKITNKTLVSWFTLESLSELTKAGSVITLDKVTADQFDGIIFAERQPNRWMNGSSNFRRTQDFNPGGEETVTGEEVMMAITYEDIGGGQVKVTGYRNGEEIGTYNSANLRTWPSGDAEIIFGKRHGNRMPAGPGALDALIHEAQIYGAAGNADEIMDLHLSGPGGGTALEFTNITYNTDDGAFTLEWNSKPNKTYALYYSLDLSDWEADIDDSIASEGETTSYSF